MTEQNSESHMAPSAADDSPSRNGSELEQLQRRVRELEQAHASTQAELAKVRCERDHYLADVYVLLRREFLREGPPTEAELRRMIDEEHGLPLEGFIDDLERIATGS